jgi:hypothetical protein
LRVRIKGVLTWSLRVRQRFLARIEKQVDSMEASRKLILYIHRVPRLIRISHLGEHSWYAILLVPLDGFVAGA